MCAYRGAGARQVSDPPPSGLLEKKDIHQIITPKIKIIFKTILLG
jgi:hypothetical protein